MAINPAFILLDEPFAGVDPIAVEDIQMCIRDRFGIADVTIENILCGRDHTVIGENIRRIQAMTPADVQRLAQKYLCLLYTSFDD